MAAVPHLGAMSYCSLVRFVWLNHLSVDPQNFLLLDEIERPNMRFTLEEKKDASVEIKDLICYWDKVNILVECPNVDIQNKKTPVRCASFMYCYEM